MFYLKTNISATLQQPLSMFVQKLQNIQTLTLTGQLSQIRDKQNNSYWTAQNYEILSRYFPIVYVDKEAQPTERRIPAVKLTSVGGEWLIVPLALSELGALYDEHHDFTGWDCYDIQGGWNGVQMGFRDLIEYPQPMLDKFLEVLRTGRFPGGESLQFRNWSVACWGRDSPLKIEAKCCECKAIRNIIPRHLSVLPKDIAKFRCLDTGVPCVELIRPVSLKGKREAPSSVGFYVPGSMETVASHSPPSTTPQNRSEGCREDSAVQETHHTITLQA